MSLHVDAGLKSLPSLNDGLINDGLPEVNQTLFQQSSTSRTRL